MAVNWGKLKEVEPKKLKISERTIMTGKCIIAQNFLNSLQTILLHYCRRLSSKSYLETLWLSKKEVYRAYKKYCTWFE